MENQKGAIALIGLIMNSLILFPDLVLAIETAPPLVGQEAGTTLPNQNQVNQFNSETGKLAGKEKNMGHLNLRAKYLIATPIFDVYGKKYQLQASGVQIEILRGMEIPTVPGLNFGVGVSYLSLVGENHFTADVNGDPILENNLPWKVSPVLHASTAMAKCGYNLDLGMVQIGLENGVGLGYFYQQLQWEYYDPSNNNTVIDGYIEREDVFKPCVDWNIKFDFHINASQNLGLIFSALTVPVFIRLHPLVNISGVPVRTESSMALYKHDVILGVGANWRINF